MKFLYLKIVKEMHEFALHTLIQKAQCPSAQLLQKGTFTYGMGYISGN